MNSWQEERDARQRQPQIPARLAIPNLEGALKTGREFEADPTVSSDTLDMWEMTTGHMLELAFGKGERPDSFKRATGPATVRRAGPDAAAQRARDRKAKHRAQLTKLQGLIEVLKQTPGSPTALLSPEGDTPATKMPTNIDVFISHSALDETLAGALANLMRTALRLSSKRIRCTSVDGYTLPAGANVSETLRQEIEASPVFLAVMTETSSESEYVKAEIGARWMTRRYAVMLVAGGYKRSDIRGPLADTHALKLSAETDLLKLVIEVAEQLGVEPENPDSIHRLVKDLASLAAARRTPSTQQTAEAQPAPELSSELVQVLQVFVDREDRHRGAPGPSTLAQDLTIQVSDAKDRLIRLAAARMLTGDGVLDPYRLSQAGRAYILRLRASNAPS